MATSAISYMPHGTRFGRVATAETVAISPFELQELQQGLFAWELPSSLTLGVPWAIMLGLAQILSQVSSMRCSG